jgi:POT family proton-dependent oligopeptide transporter
MKPLPDWNEADWIATLAAFALFLILALGALLATRRSEDFAGHPRGLYLLFYAEMWERFSYYGMRGLLILYLTRYWLFSDGKASLIYGAYTALVYITPLLGGYLADRWLGRRKAVVYGGVLLALGHALMAVEGVQAVTDPAIKQADPMIDVFWLALALIIVGSGFLRANISVLVGQLYRLTDVRRDGAYTIFYMGINIGAALGTILVGYLGETLGWTWGFGLAGIGMVCGLLIFLVGRTALRGQGEPPKPLPHRTEYALYGVGFAAVVLAWVLIRYQHMVQTLLMVVGVAMLGYILTVAARLPKEPRERIFAILFLIALNPMFWGLYEQAGGSLNLYTDRYVDRAEVPASLFQSINPIYIVLLGPVFAALWQWLGKRGLEPSAPAKFGLAIIQLGLGFLILVAGANAAGAQAPTPVIFVFLIYLLNTTGELCLSPVGLSAMTRLSPAQLASFVIGAWFYMNAVGNFVAGKIGEATGSEGGMMSRELTLSVYSQLGWIALGIGLIVLLLARVVKRWMHLDTLRDEPPPRANSVGA